MNAPRYYYADSENEVALRLIRFILAKGLSIAIWEGEDWAIRRSTSETALIHSLASTGEDKLVVFSADGKTQLGFILLIWGNADDGSELIADHSDNEAINSLIRLGGF